MTGHVDQKPTLGPKELGLRPSGEPRTVDDDYSANATNTIATTAVTFWVRKANNSYVADGAKTGEAKCNRTNNTCIYP